MVYQRKARIVVNRFGAPAGISNLAEAPAGISNLPEELYGEVAGFSTLKTTGMLAGTDGYAYKAVKPALRRAKEEKRVAEEKLRVPAKQQQDAHILSDAAYGELGPEFLRYESFDTDEIKIPGLTKGGVILLGLGDGSVKNVFALIGKFMMFKEKGDGEDELKAKFKAWLKSKGITTNLDKITDIFAEKVDMYFPGIFG